MTSIAVQTTDKTIQHPAWCDLTECYEDRTGGYLRMVSHRNPGAELTVPSRFLSGGGIECTVQMVRHDNKDGEFDSEPTTTMLELRASDEIAVDDLERFARWLLARTAQYRQAIATEGGVR